MATVTDLEKIDSKKNIVIKGARVHNLKNIDVVIPRNKFVVVTGVSGSGKSSLAFDTLYAEGQRRYVESLSAYARQFLGKINKPDVDYIKGVAPAIAIEQKVVTRTSRSTVGTSTEIYDYLKLLYARIGKTYSPISNKIVKRDTISDVVDHILSLKEGTTVMILSPLHLKEGRTLRQQLDLLLQQGFSRIEHKGKIYRLDEVIEGKEHALKPEEMKLVIDRLEIIKEELNDLKSRASDSVQTAFYEGNGICEVDSTEGKKTHKHTFSDRFEADGMKFDEPTAHFFSFNNPVGACKRCEGFGSVIDIDEDLVIPDKSLSLYEEAIACWRGEKMSWWKDQAILHARKNGFPVHRPYMDLTEKEKAILWNGTKEFEGIHQFFKHLEQESYKIQYRVMLSRYRGKTLCPDCRGTRLRKDANYVKINGKSISDMVLMPVDEAYTFFKNLPEKLDKNEKEIAKRLNVEITNRLQFMCDVGLGYLMLNRPSNTLSGGESQRLNLATSLGSSLVGSLYVLDEPSIGLHHRDTKRLIEVLIKLRNLGNTLVVVEHDEDIMRAADEIIDIGPLAGTNGGTVVFQGTPAELKLEKVSLTAQYLNGKESIPVPKKRRSAKNFIEICKARENNLKNVTIKFPTGALTVVTGVSGSGKSSLIKGTLYPGLKRMLGQYTGEKAGKFEKIEGATDKVKEVEMVDQSPIGRSSRSNPVTYVKAFDEIRTLFADQKLAQMRGYKASHFSFNVAGGRCDICEGEGEVTIEMQFMADVHLVCDVCNGKRFKDDVLEVLYHGKSISDVLNMTIDESIDFFSQDMNSALLRRLVEKLTPLRDVGMGYVQLGQSSSTLSGGEAQRIKLATFLSKGNEEGSTLFIFDEPTTGLHFHDIKKLLKAFNMLVDKGHTLVVIEHHPDVMKCADWLIDLGPEGGEKGGNLVFQGVPEDLLKSKTSYTAEILREKLK
ncbi:MAG TPA: excinuclease ABC subunit UvrA [Bacteroidia bacterium]|nr:excinuclease ABC subunit UvrA [Bacteroidia bacterium]